MYNYLKKIIVGIKEKRPVVSKKSEEFREKSVNATAKIENLTKYQSLTPSIGSVNETYETVFTQIFSQNDLKNIGIMGGYGSGKSTLLKNLKETSYADKSFIHVEIGTYDRGKTRKITGKPRVKRDKSQENIESSEETAGFNISLQDMESKIMNQLLYQIPPKKIPDTRLLLRRHRSRGKILNSAILATITSFLTLYLIYFRKITEIIGKFGGYSENLLPFLQFLWLVTPFLLFFLGVFYIYHLLLLLKSKLSFKRFSLFGNEVELFTPEHNSNFDKHLEEILYLLEKSDADVIVFEDIDRFDSSIIFERLRELNFLANKKRVTHPLRFFYLVRDDLFTPKERTKFFDFIVPVVSVVSSRNAYDKILLFLAEFPKEKMPDLVFLRQISRFFDDMRLLKNISNEFQIYSCLLQGVGQIPEKMFAFIVYKNLFPEDFIDLQRNRGGLYRLFYEKETFLLSIRDNFSEFHSDSLENEASFWEFKKEICPLNLMLFLRRIRDMSSEDMKENLLFSYYSFCFQKDINSIEYFSLLRFLVENGHISENYQGYYSYFYGDDCAKIDESFISSVVGCSRGVDFPTIDEGTLALRLHDYRYVVEELYPQQFCNSSCMNIHLLHYLFENDSRDSDVEKIENMIKQVVNTSCTHFISLFLEEYLCTDGKKLHKYWRNLPEVLEPLGCGDLLSTYVLHQFEHLSPQELSSYYHILQFTNVIEENYEAVLEIFDSCPNLKHKMKLLRVEFDQLPLKNEAEWSEKEERFCHYVIENRAFSCNVSNVYRAYLFHESIKYRDKSSKTLISLEKFAQRGLSTLYETEKNELLDYVRCEIVPYFISVFVALRGAEKNALPLLENEEVIFEMLDLLPKAEHTDFALLCGVKLYYLPKFSEVDTIYVVIRCKIVYFTLDFLIDIAQCVDMTSGLVELLNKHPEPEDFFRRRTLPPPEGCTFQYNDGEIAEFMEKVKDCTGFSNEVQRVLLHELSKK